MEENSRNPVVQEDTTTSFLATLRQRYRSARAKFPRSFAFFLWVFIPLWLLVFLSLLGGNWLTRFEAPKEYATNDAVIKARFLFNLSNPGIYQEKLVNLPMTCFYDYLNETNVTRLPDGRLVPDEAITTEMLLSDLSIQMKECSAHAKEVLDLHNGRQEQVFSLSIVPLTFNWIRCWDQQVYGRHNPVQPTPEQILAAGNQTLFYEETWLADQARLYQGYIRNETTGGGNESDTNSTTPCQGLTCYNRLALDRSVAEATGRHGCGSNIAAAAWFFFTVMTTVGYGNQAPVTGDGRNLVTFLGLLSLLAFGTILASAGSIVSILFEDFAKRLKWNSNNRKHSRARRLINVHIECLWWFLLTFLWIIFVGERSATFWKDRSIPGGEVPNKWWDSMWFAYISLTTIGLGDYFLPPEVLFLGDVFVFVWLFLMGFTLFSGFLGKLSEVLRHWTGTSSDLENELEKVPLASEDNDSDNPSEQTNDEENGIPASDSDDPSQQTNDEESRFPATDSDDQSEQTYDEVNRIPGSDLTRLLEQWLQAVTAEEGITDDPALVERETALLEQVLDQRKKIEDKTTPS
eukprot:scaffold21455_cov116-Cylindrotheca_fusiformis.AAC.19